MLSRLARPAVALVARRAASQASNPISALLFDTPDQPELSVEISGVPAPVKGTKAPAAGPIQVSKSSSGFTIVTQDFGGPVATVALHIKAGSRYETTPGVAAVVERIAFGIATTRRSALKLIRDVEDSGATVAARTTREEIVYSGRALRDEVDAVVSAVAEAALQPRLREYDVEEAKHAVEALVADRAAEPAAAVEDALHAAAFGAGSPLGRPLLLTPAALHGVTAEAVRAHLAACYTPGRMVLAGTNVPHADLKAMADHFFGPPPAAAAGGAAAPAAAGARSAWVGGERLSRVPGSPLATVAVAFPAPHAGDAAGAAAAAVLRALLGEGEGAGARARRPARHSAIARAVHTEAHSFIRAARAINAAYADAGLIGVVGEAADADAGRLAAALAGFVKAAAAAPPTPAALAAAKAAVKLRLAAAAEGAGSAAGALGERAGAGATPAPLAERLAAVDAVTAAGVQAVARAAVAAPPAVAAHGSLDAFPRYDQVVSLIAA